MKPGISFADRNSALSNREFGGWAKTAKSEIRFLPNREFGDRVKTAKHETDETQTANAVAFGVAKSRHETNPE